MKGNELILSLLFMYFDFKDAGKKNYAEVVGLALKLLCDSDILNDKEKDYKI